MYLISLFVLRIVITGIRTVGWTGGKEGTVLWHVKFLWMLVWPGKWNSFGLSWLHSDHGTLPRPNPGLSMVAGWATTVSTAVGTWATLLAQKAIEVDTTASCPAPPKQISNGPPYLKFGDTPHLEIPSSFSSPIGRQYGSMDCLTSVVLTLWRVKEEKWKYFNWLILNTHTGHQP